MVLLSPPESQASRVQRESREIRGIIRMVAAGHARRMVVSGYLAASVTAALSAEAINPGVTLTLSHCPDGSCVVHVGRAAD